MKFNRYTFQKVALALSIIVVLNLLFNYGIYTFYPSPQQDDFCSEESRQYYGDKDSCEAVGGEWRASGAVPVRSVEPGAQLFEKATEYCDAAATCRGEFEDANSLYNRNVFVGLVILGTISLALGFFLVEVSAISFGFLFGGLLSLFIGTVRYWSDMNDYLRLVVLVVVLAVLIALGYKKLKDKQD